MSMNTRSRTSIPCPSPPPLSTLTSRSTNEWTLPPVVIFGDTDRVYIFVFHMCIIALYIGMFITNKCGVPLIYCGTSINKRWHYVL